MTVRRPLVNIAGAIQELPLTDAMPSGAGYTRVDVGQSLIITDQQICLMSNQFIVSGQITLQGDSILTHN